MALQNITPQYQAEEKTAQFHLRPVPIYNGLYETGKMLTEAGQGLQKGTFSLALGLKQRNDKLQAERDDLALTDALNKATTEGTKFAAELNKRTGREAEGNTQKLDTFMDNMLANSQANLTPRAARIFGQRFASLRLSLWNSVNGHEFSNTRSASIAEKKNLVQNGLATYQLTEDPNDLIAALGYQADLYEAQYGVRLPDSLLEDWGRRWNPETGKFDGAKKNMGWLGIFENDKGQAVTELSRGYKINGKETEVPALNPYTADYVDQIMKGDITPEIDERIRKWGEDRIAQGKSPFYDGDPEDESIRVLNDSQKAVEGRLKIFMMERQNVVDAAAGLIAEKYSKDGDVGSLYELYNAIDQEGLPVGDAFLPVSPEAKLQIKQVLDQQLDYQETFYGARAIFGDIKASDPRSMGGEYWTEKQDQYFWNVINDLESSSDSKDQKKAQYIRSWYSDLVKTQQRNLGIAVEEAAAGLFQSKDPVMVGHDLMMLENIMSTMPDNPVRDQLQILHDKWQNDYNEGEAKLDKAFAEAWQKNEEARTKELEAEQKRRDAQQAAINKAWHDDDSRKRAVARFKLGFYTNDRQISFKDGTTFDLKTENGQNAFIAFCTYNEKNGSGWLFPEDIAYFREMFSGQIASDARSKAARLIAGVLNETRDDKPWTEVSVNDMMPDLVDDVMRKFHTGDNPTDAKPLGAEREADSVKTYVSGRLLERATIKVRPSIFWNLVPGAVPYYIWGKTDGETTLRDFMNEGIDKYGNLYPEEQTHYNLQSDFNKLKRTDDQDAINNFMRTKLDMGETADVEDPISFMLWAERRRAAQTVATEEAEE